MASDLTRYAAANARARALMSRLVGRDGLETLAGYPSAAAVVDALQRTAYASVLTPGVRADRALPERAAAVGRALLRTLTDPEGAFLRLYLLHHEIDNLKVLLRAVHAQIPSDAMAHHLTPLAGIGTLDLPALIASRDIPDLIERLGGSPYAAPLRHAVPRWRTAGSFALEVAVELDFYDRLWAATATLDRRDAVVARALLGTLFDILNLSWISRYREACGLSPEETLNYTLRQGRWLTATRRQDLAGLPGRPWDAALARTPYAAVFTRGAPFGRLATALTEMLARTAQQACAKYPFHIGVPLACLMAYDIEIRDLQRLLAAKTVDAGTAVEMEHVATVRH